MLAGSPGSAHNTAEIAAGTIRGSTIAAPPRIIGGIHQDN
jgi:hypothetical protein